MFIYAVMKEILMPELVIARHITKKMPQQLSPIPTPLPHFQFVLDLKMPKDPQIITRLCLMVNLLKHVAEENVQLVVALVYVKVNFAVLMFVGHLPLSNLTPQTV